MATFFRGRFEGTVDDKGRVFLPKVIYNSLGTQKKLVVTNGFSQGFQFLDVYPMVAWIRLEQRLSKMSQLRSDVQDFSRFYLSGGQNLDPDKTQRVLIPHDLRSYAGINSHLLFVGMGEKFEIWSKPRWTELYGKLTQQFDQTVKSVSGELK